VYAVLTDFYNISTISNTKIIFLPTSATLVYASKQSRIVGAEVRMQTWKWVRTADDRSNYH